MDKYTVSNRPDREVELTDAQIFNLRGMGFVVKKVRQRTADPKSDSDKKES